MFIITIKYTLNQHATDLPVILSVHFPFSNFQKAIFKHMKHFETFSLSVHRNSSTLNSTP